MLSKYTKVNKYGGSTWHIELENLYHIFIHGTETRSFIIECKEWKWLGYKTHFSFVSDKDLNEAVIDAFARTYDFAKNKNNAWSHQSQMAQLTRVLNLLSEDNNVSREQKIYSMREDGYYIARISGNNPDTGIPFVVSIILIFKGEKCAEFQVEGPIQSSDINRDIFNIFVDGDLDSMMTYAITDGRFKMRDYKYKDDEEWDEWSGRVVSDGMILSMNSHFFSYGHMKLVDIIRFKDAHFKFFAR